ncbi:MAG: hypothetical protein IJ250_07905 [Bacteroidales bacterium]|nr:hypothetical protein [Bacteroidales bacterium]
MGWFFKKKKAVDLQYIKTDIHSHMLPGIDDGASSMAESVHLIKQMRDLGYKKMIITPHVRFGSFDNDTAEFESRLREVVYALQESGIEMELEVGAEQTIDEGFKEHFRNGELKHFGRNKYLLIEFPFNMLPMNIKDTVFDLQSAGYSLILAHPERYLYLREQKDMIDYLHDSNVLFQLNILSLTGFYDKATRNFARWLIKKDYIDLVGTDLHHQKHLDGVKKALTDKYLHKLVDCDRLMNSMF